MEAIRHRCWYEDDNCTTARDQSGEYPFDDLVMNYRLCITNVVGTERQSITGQGACFARVNELNDIAAWYLKPGWSPDGSRLAFVSYVPNSIYFDKLYMLDSMVGNCRLVLTDDNQNPVFAPHDPVLIVKSHAEGNDLYPRFRPVPKK